MSKKRDYQYLVSSVKLEALSNVISELKEEFDLCKRNNIPLTDKFLIELDKLPFEKEWLRYNNQKI